MSRLLTIDEAVKVLLEGGVGVMPTDTVYGLVARAGDVAAVRRFYDLKKRERKPGTVIAASVAQLVGLGVPEAQLRRVMHLWPASLSVICESGEDLAFLHLGLRGLAVRIPADDVVRGWLERTGPLVTTSANRPGEPNAVNLAEARAYFEDGVDFYVDGGDLSGRAPSTIVRMGMGGIEVLREGAVRVDG